MRKIESVPFDSEFSAFLEGLKPHSRNAYRSLIAYWVNFSHMNGKETLEFAKGTKDGELEKKIVEFKSYIQKLGKSDAFAKLGTNAVRGFLRSHRIRCDFTPSETGIINDNKGKIKYYRFTKEDLAKMVSESVSPTLEEKYIVLVGASIGFRVGDFKNLRYSDFRSVHIEGEAPIGLGEIITEKKKAKAYPFLSSDAQNIVKLILEKNPNAKNEDRVLDLDEHTINKTLQRLFEKAHLESGSKRVRFHCLRAYLSTKLSSVASESQWKQIVGKKISESAYIGQEELREIYLRAMPSIIINGNGKALIKVEILEETVKKLEGEIASRDAEIEILRKNQKTFEKMMSDFSELPTIKKEMFARKEKVPIT